MKLRALSLTNVRRFAGQTARLGPIGDGITVLAAPNETGKSTFFDALHTLFFVPYGSAAKEAKSLQPHAGGPVSVSAEIETDEGLFTLQKTWLSRKSARVSDTATGRIVAQDDEAEAWIRARMHGGLGGPAGLLWVRQGLTGLEPDAKAEKDRLLETRRDLMSSVAGEIDLMTGGRRMDRVLSACKEALGTLATGTGKPRTGGPWKAAEDEAASLREEAARQRVILDSLSDNLAKRRRAEADLAKSDTPEEEARRATRLATARSALEAAKAHVDALAQANDAVKIATLERDNAARVLADMDTRDTALLVAVKKQATAVEVEEKAATARETAAKAHGAATEALQTITGTVTALRTRLKTAQIASRAAAARQSAADLAARLEKAETREAERREAEKTAAALAVTPRLVNQLADATQTRDRLRARTEAQAVQIRFHYTGTARAMLDGVELPDNTDTPIAGRAALILPGLGTMDITPGAGSGADTLAADLRDAEDTLAGLLTPLALPDLKAARDMLARKQEALQKAALAAEVLATLAPRGLDALRAELTTAQDAAGQDTGEGEDPDALAADLTRAEAEEARTRTLYERSRGALGLAVEKLAEGRTAARLAREALTRASEEAGTVEARAASRKAAEVRLAETDAALEAAQKARENLAALAPDLDTAKAELNRAEGVVRAAEQARRDLSEQIQNLSGLIRARAEDGVEETHAETLGRLQSAEARAARFSREAAALGRLQTALEHARRAARDAYFEPVKEELLPLLRLIHADAELHLDDQSLLPASLSRGGEDEGMEILSGGTAEQIAVLTRLAFARLYARTGRALPIVMDDALVYSDDDRIERMFTALHRVAADQQILVLTCRQRAFAQLGGEIARITVEDA